MTEVLSMKIPSHRIRLANVAYHWFTAQPRCRIDMWRYHRRVLEHCYACYGGAAAIYAYGHQGQLDPRSLPGCADTVRLRLMDYYKDGVGNAYQVALFEQSLDAARQGFMVRMFALMDLDPEHGSPFDRRIPDYTTGGPRFLQAMEILANDLEQAGY